MNIKLRKRGNYKNTQVKSVQIYILIIHKLLTTIEY